VTAATALWTCASTAVSRVGVGVDAGMKCTSPPRSSKAVGDEGVQVHEQPEVAAESLDHHQHAGVQRLHRGQLVAPVSGTPGGVPLDEAMETFELDPALDTGVHIGCTRRALVHEEAP